jgi:hypothetical protein
VQCARSHRALSQAAFDTNATIWVKRLDVPGTRFSEVEDVDLQQTTVSKFTKSWAAQAKLDIDLSLITLRLLMSCTGDEPTADDESAAKLLRPRLTLAAAGITDGCSLLASVAGTAVALPGECVEELRAHIYPGALPSLDCQSPTCRAAFKR